MAAEAAVSSAVQILGELLIQKVNFLLGVADEVEWLKDELVRMKCFLKDATEKQTDNESVRNWISEIRDVAQDSEDAIELFVLKVESETSRLALLRSCTTCSPSHVYHLNKVGKEIESIRKRLQDIESSRISFGIKNVGEEAEESGSRILENVEQWRRLPVWQKDEHLVGIDEDEELLLHRSILDDKKKGLSITAIVGMGGIGKSTLAKKIYNHEAVASRFECRAWVVVSSEFAAEDVFKQIMMQLQISLPHDFLKLLESIKDKLSRKAMLEKELHKHLVGKRFFIVLDDVWEYAHWQSLRSAFPDEGRLLITSRNHIIDEHDAYIHKMRLLSFDKSLKLLLKTAFLGKTDAKCPQELEGIATEILKKCDGLPLAIKVAGGLLVNQEVLKSRWEKVLKQMPEPIEDNSPNVSAILELSYWNLPARLKPCFLCLGFFEEDDIIRAKTLLHIWIVQGFISTGSEGVGGELLVKEERAMNYLNELINRNLVQVEGMVGTSGEVKNCRIHDLLRDLAIRKAKEEIGFEIIIKEPEEGNSSISKLAVRKPRHVVYRSGQGFLSSWHQNKHLRSLFINNEPGRSLLSPWYQHDLSLFINNEFAESKMSRRPSCQLLKILDVEARLVRRLPHVWQTLIGLKYLRIRVIFKSYFKIPTWFDRLKNLEVLQIENGEVELPKSSSTWKMDSLRHFCASSIIGLLKSDTWKNLETLKYINPLHLNPLKVIYISSRIRKLGMILADYSAERVACDLLGKLENVTHLHLKVWLDFRPLLEATSRLDQLTKLKLSGVNFLGLLDASMFPRNITRLTLSGYNFTPSDFITLGKLPNLRSLKLSKIGPHHAEELRVLSDGFPRLQVLSLHWLRESWCIYVEEGGMPELRRVNISNCPMLKHNLDQYGAPVINIS